MHEITELLNECHSWNQATRCLPFRAHIPCGVLLRYQQSLRTHLHCMELPCGSLHPLDVGHNDWEGLCSYSLSFTYVHQCLYSLPHWPWFCHSSLAQMLTIVTVQAWALQFLRTCFVSSSLTSFVLSMIQTVHWPSMETWAASLHLRTSRRFKYLWVI
jgi:hypothetical protein